MLNKEPAMSAITSIFPMISPSGCARLPIVSRAFSRWGIHELDASPSQFAMKAVRPAQ